MPGDKLVRRVDSVASWTRSGCQLCGAKNSSKNHTTNIKIVNCKNHKTNLSSLPVFSKRSRKNPVKTNPLSLSYGNCFTYRVVLLTAYPFLDPGLNEKIFTDTAGSAMMDTPGKN